MIQGSDTPIYWSRLANNLRLIEDLWQKLVYVKWSQESFGLLPRLVHDMVNTTRSYGDENLIELATQLAYHVNLCVAAGRIPQDMERERLLALLDKLRQSLSATENEPEPRTRPWSAAAYFFVVSTDYPRQLLLKLEDVGFRTRHFTTPADLEAALDPRVPPAAVLLDMDLPDRPLGGIGALAELRARRELKAAVFFMTERDDMTARLDAVRAGAAGYFTKPLDVAYVLETLKNRLFFQTPAGHPQRVLIVDDTAEAAEPVAAILRNNGLTARVVGHPLHTIQDIHRFQPDLLVVNLDLTEVDGLELIQVLGQHRAVDILPMILLASPVQMNRHLARLQTDTANTDLVAKPVAAGYLNWLVRQRLHQAAALRSRLGALNHKDPVSGLYNRRYFLVQLERSLAALGVSARSLALMLISLDNLGLAQSGVETTVLDTVLERAAARLRKVLGPQPLAARFGDALFAVLINDARREALLTSAQVLRDALETDVYDVDERAVLLHTSIGISFATRKAPPVQTLLQQATLACSLAHENKSRIYVYSDQEGNRDKEEYQRQSLLEETRQALDHQRTWLVFQPIVSLRGDPGERYEALLRIRDRENGVLFSETVFSIAQRQSVGMLLDRRVIEQAIRIEQKRLAAGKGTILFIKVLPVTLQDHSLRGWLEERFKQAGITGEHLVFQVVEAAAERELREVLRFAEDMRALGCKLCLERFGRNADSVGLLRRLPVDYVKFDPYLIQGLADDKAKQAQLKALVEGVEPLNTATIVGGIEDMRTLPVLWSYGIHYVQGFFLQRPHEEMSYDFAGYTF